ncbi:MAG: hypothetical protein HeimC2_18610 [Candidatus Heimdallarchaeota archaeon LC_2]|nr:MAG: hypothetical protein HeimC2_18610 [Candidatus Heimdallarchaeota archaeon LC_2]
MTISTISLTDEATGLPLEKIKEYEVPLEVTFAKQFKNTDILVFCSTLNNSNLSKAVCTVVLVGKNSVYYFQKNLKQSDYDNIEITELLTLLHILAEIKDKSKDSEFRDHFQIGKDRTIRVQINLNNLISKKVIEKTINNQFIDQHKSYAFLLELLQTQLNHASQLGIDIKLNYDFQFHEYTIYCNLQCHKVLLNDKITNSRQIYPIPTKIDRLKHSN